VDGQEWQPRGGQNSTGTPAHSLPSIPGGQCYFLYLHARQIFSIYLMLHQQFMSSCFGPMHTTVTDSDHYKLLQSNLAEVATLISN
jgi:hypothetical protein